MIVKINYYNNETINLIIIVLRQNTIILRLKSMVKCMFPYKYYNNSRMKYSKKNYQEHQTSMYNHSIFTRVKI